VRHHAITDADSSIGTRRASGGSFSFAVPAGPSTVVPEGAAVMVIAHRRRMKDADRAEQRGCEIPAG
jgi:hypothetical protein